MAILVVLLFLRSFVMEENVAEEEKTDHRKESGRVVRISGDDEPSVLRVLQRSNWNLRRMIMLGESNSVVVDFELTDSINDGKLEGGEVDVR